MFKPALSQSGTCKKDSLAMLSARSSEGLIGGKHKRGFFSLPLMVTNGFSARLPGWEKGSSPHMSVYTNKFDKVGLKGFLTMMHTVGLMSGNIYCHYDVGRLHQLHKFSTNPNTQDATQSLCHSFTASMAERKPATLTASSSFGIANRIKSILSGAFWKNICSGHHSDDKCSGESADALTIDCTDDFSI